MKKYALVWLLFSAVHAYAFDIYALGTSATNCKGVAREFSYTVKLQEYLNASGMEARVINGGINGDKPVWMVNRAELIIDKSKYPDVKLVIFEPGPNDSNPSSNREYSEKVLEKFQTANMPVIFASPKLGGRMTEKDGAEIAGKFNAFYYGFWSKGTVDNDPEWRQFDYATPEGGHLTAKGCMKVAEQMSAFIKQLVDDKKLKFD